MSDLREAFARWVRDIRERPDDYKSYEEMGERPVEEVAESCAVHIVHNLNAIGIERQKATTVADGGRDDPMMNGEGEEIPF